MKERILVIKLSSFGDVLFAMGPLQDIAEYHAGAEITVLTQKPYKKIFDRCPWVHRVIVDPHLSKWRLDYLWQLKRTVRFDSFARVYDLQKASRTAFYFRWLAGGAPWSGYVKGCQYPYTFEKGESLTGVEEFTRQLSAAGVPTRHVGSPSMSWMAEDVTSLLEEASVQAPYVLLMPGASARHQHKCWPYYTELAQALIRQGLNVVTAPGPDDLELCRQVPGVTLLNADGSWLNFFQLAGLQAGAAYCVGNDSGPTHLAAHMRAPTLALFGQATARYAANMQRNAAHCLIAPQVGDITVSQVLQYMQSELEMLST